MSMSPSTPSRPMPSRHRRLALRSSLAAVALAGIAFGGSGATGWLAGRGAAPPVLPTHGVADREGDDAIRDYFSRFALNALLVPLLDDDEPPRWSDAALSHVCGPATQVEVDGKPLANGSRMPATAFAVRWHMDQCTPLEAIELTGTVELFVFHDDSGLTAVVDPEGLIISSEKGRSRMRSPFTATLSLSSTEGRP